MTMHGLDVYWDLRYGGCESSGCSGECYERGDESLAEHLVVFRVRGEEI